MAKESGHQNQIELNKRFLHDLQMKNVSDNYYDWRVTVAFYATLHMIEKVLFRNFKKNSKNHADRKRLIRENICFSCIRTEYGQLSQLSYKARYLCSSISEQEYKDAITYMQNIEKELNGVQ